MPGQRQPTNLLLAKGNKHFTKAEIKERLSNEVDILTDNIAPPPYLTKKKQRDEFNKIAQQLQALKIMSETDVDTLARYILSRDLYVKLTKQITSSKEILETPPILTMYFKNQDRAFKQCRACAIDLGLTITSRCKLIVPKTDTPEKHKNKFEKFEKHEGEK